MSRLLLAWFTTKNGKTFTRTCVGIAGFSILGCHLAIHGPLQEKVRSLCQIYSKGKPRPLSSRVQDLIDSVFQDSKLKSEEQGKIKFFNVVGQDLYHSGDVRSPYGAMIGIPFMFEDLDNINFGELRLVGEESIDWVVDGHDLLRAMTLSDNAKKFAIMREIHLCNIWNVLDSATIGAGSLLFGAELARRANVMRNAFEKSLSGRMKVYFFCYAFSFCLYRCLQDPTRHITEKNCDKLSATTGPEYLEGGLEFYEKALARNKALRTLMKAKGERKFDKDGNENYFLLAPRLPVRKRLELLQDLKKELQTVTM